MNYTIINIKSITQAERSRAFLAEKGIKSRVERSFAKGGCGFALRVYGARAEVCALLRQIGVYCGIS